MHSLFLHICKKNILLLISNIMFLLKIKFEKKIKLSFLIIIYISSILEDISLLLTKSFCYLIMTLFYTQVLRKTNLRIDATQMFHKCEKEIYKKRKYFLKHF